MLQGMARGAVGDIVFSRLNGQQIARVRNRNPKNPKTNAQLYQRAVMATVMQAYSAGKVIFDHAFQGRSVGGANQREFMSRNAKILRGLLAADLQTGSSKARFVAPGGIYPVGFEGMQISAGTYPQELFAITPGTGSGVTSFRLPVPLTPEGGTAETIQEYIERNNVLPNDIYTLILFTSNYEEPQLTVDGESEYGTYYSGAFSYIRLRVRQDIADLDGDAGTITYRQLFTVDKTNLGSVDFLDDLVGDSINFNDIVIVDYALGAFGIIRSRFDQDLRSDSYLVFSTGEPFQGLTSQYVLDAWKMGSAQIGDSDLILEGAGSVSSTPAAGTAFTLADGSTVRIVSVTWGSVSGNTPAVLTGDDGTQYIVQNQDTSSSAWQQALAVKEGWSMGEDKAWISMPESWTGGVIPVGLDGDEQVANTTALIQGLGVSYYVFMRQP